MLIPPPKHEEKEVYDSLPTRDSARDARIKESLNVCPWKCECGLTNFGGNKLCADFKCKKLRPEGFVERPR